MHRAVVAGGTLVPSHLSLHVHVPYGPIADLDDSPSTVMIRSAHGPTQAEAEEEADAEAAAAQDKLERRRRQCRISQRRYRDKKGSMEYNLRLDVNNLRARVARLSQERDVLETKLWNGRRALTGPIVKALRQYYQVFADGLHDPNAGVHVQHCYALQRDFATALMAPDVCFSGGYGVAFMLDQWRRYTQYHSSFHVDLLGVDVHGSDDEPIAQVRCTMTVRLNRSTLQMLFPQALTDEAMVQALIGQRVTYQVFSELVFNEKVQVTSEYMTVDFVAGLRGLVGATASLDLFSDARIANDSVLGYSKSMDDLERSAPVA